MFYSLCGQIIQQMDQTKYLEINIGQELDWSTHIESTSYKANSTLGLLRRNLKSCHEKLREMAYFSQVRLVLEYGATVWVPHYQEGERVQRCSAHFVKKSTTGILQINIQIQIQLFIARFIWFCCIINRPQMGMASMGWPARL